MSSRWRGRARETQPGQGPRPTAIQGCYRCRGRDNWVSITIPTDARWQGFGRALGHSPWTEEVRFSDVVGRYRHHDELDKLIEEWTTRRDHFEVMYLLQEEGVVTGPLEDDQQAYEDPHLKARSYFEKVTHAEAGTHLYPGMNWKMSHARLRVRLLPVRLGEHNEYVYKELMGVPDEEYANWSGLGISAWTMLHTSTETPACSGGGAKGGGMWVEKRRP